MNQKSQANGGDLLVEVLREAGVDTVFGIVSVHNLPLVEAVAEQLRFVPVRHEASAVNAADGYARATGGLGCALTSTGTGAGNAAGSLVESLAAGTSVLHITGQVQVQYLGSGRGFIHETKDQSGMLAAVSAHAATITDAASAGEILRDGVRRALTRRGGPVSIEWPIDLQYAAQDPAAATIPPVAALPTPAEAELDAIRAEIARARRPVIWAGGGAGRAGRQLTELIERWGVPLLTSNSGRGAVDEAHRLCVGNYGATPGGRELLADADLLISLGTHFRSNETGDYSIPVPARHVQVDLDPAAPGRVFATTVSVVADVDAVLGALLATVEFDGLVDPDWTTRATDTRTAVRSAQREALGDHALLCDAVRRAFPASSPVARDVTIASSAWGNRLLPISDPRTNIFPRGGGIGQGLGMAIGAALADETHPTLGIAGDGGLAVHLGELLTVAQERPWLVLMVFNDAGYGVLRNMQATTGPTYAVDLATPDFQQLSAAIGLEYRRIGGIDDAADVLADAVAVQGPVVVEVDLATFGPMPKPFTPPVSVPK